VSRLDAEPQYQERLARIEHDAELLASYSGWDTIERPRKYRMAYTLVDAEIPWLIGKLRALHEENERQLQRIRELGYKREEAVKALQWALDQLGEAELELAEDRKGEWALRVLATLKGRPA